MECRNYMVIEGEEFEVETPEFGGTLQDRLYLIWAAGILGLLLKGWVLSEIPANFLCS